MPQLLALSYIFPSCCLTEVGSQKVISILLAAGQALFTTSAPFVLIAWWPTDCGEKEDPSKQGHPKVPKQLTGARRGIKNFQSTQSDSHPLSALLSMELPHFNITN